MDQLKERLLIELRKIDGVQDRPSPVAGGTALFYFDKEFAHFHDGNELDLRLTKKKIQALGLSHLKGSVHHPNRSPNSPWIEIRFNDENDVAQLKKLVEIAVGELSYD
ncbi:MAG: hypothetical protein JWM78_2694 [Verrucomicrobiaceae bacterium]|nr:hypothetical protein [Verrucomicrobiaceae bacterium]